MGLLDAFKQYVKDAAPGGLLNPELTPQNIRTAGEYASMTPNPIGDVASGLLAVDDLRKGNYSDAALNGLGLLPFVPALAGTMKKVSKLPYQIEHKPMSVDGGASLLHDLTSSFGDDIYTKNAIQYFGSGDPLEREALKVMQSVRGNPDAMVTIYRGVPQGVDKINPGDWVTLSKRSAEYYTDPSVVGGTKKGKIVEMKVPAKTITSWPDSLLEFGYFPD